MSDEEVEKFEITDYDLENEFNINRRRKKMSKNDQIYGIWADDTSSGEEGKPTSSAQPSYKGGRKPKNYTAPIGFVAGGVQQAGKKPTKVETKDEEEEDEEEEDEEEEEERVGFGRPQIGKGTSFRAEDYLLPDEIAGLRRKNASKNLGSWQHTKGIGAKLLLQMGYEPGKGLGKTLQGISAPIEAKPRKGRGAIGAYGPETAAKIAEPIGGTGERHEVKEKLSRWRKDEGVSRSLVKYVYKSIEEVLEQGQDRTISKAPSALSKVKVIDMTGPEQRVLSGYHAISRQQRPGDEWEARKEIKFANFALPELLHNLNLLVDMCEQDIISNDRKYKFASDQIVAAKHQVTSLDKVCEAELDQITRLERLLLLMEDLTAASEAKLLTLDKAASCFRELQDEFHEEMKGLALSELIVSLVSPIVREQLRYWQPLTQPAAPLSVIKEWQAILQQSDNRATLASGHDIGPYGKFIWHSWMPSVRNTVSEWNCRMPEPMIKFIETWMAVLPSWITDSILEQLVLPRVTLQVHNWDPMTDTVPIHAWIHPWLPLLGNRLDSVIYPVIREKLSVALTSWHPSDRSAKLMLLPWSKVFTKGDMNAFLVCNILPKLAQALDELVINPQHQVLGEYHLQRCILPLLVPLLGLDEHWRWVMEWEELLPVVSLAGLLEKHLFPRWLQVLSLWLNHTPNYEQVTSWYIGWKGQFSEALLKQPNIKDQFRQALDLMNRSAGLGQVPGGMESISYLKNVEREKQGGSSAATSRYQSLQEALLQGTQAAQTGYRALLAKRCGERDIVFVPLTNRFYQGKQVYKCGKVQVYIDRNVVFVSSNGGATWAPQSMATVLDLA